MVKIDAPPGLVPVPLKGAVLLLTAPEYLAGIRRGKWWRRRLALLQRTHPRASDDGSPRVAIPPINPSEIVPAIPPGATPRRESRGI